MDALNDYTTLHLLIATLRVGLPILLVSIVSVALTNRWERKVTNRHKKSPCDNKGNQHQVNK